MVSLAYFLFITLPTVVASIEHHFYWNSSNPIWKEADPVLHVRLGDRIRIYCPDSNKDFRTSHLKVFQVSEFSFAECMLETGKQQVVLCNGNELGRPRSTIITVRPFSSTPNALTFTVGQYYWISTSNGRPDGLDRSMFGLCKTHQMRLKLNVSERLAERQITKAPSKESAGKDLPGPTDHIPADISVNKEQLKAVLKLAVEGKTGTYKHDPVIVEPIDEAEPWNPIEMNSYRNYYRPDLPFYQDAPVLDSRSSKDYEIGEEPSFGRSNPSYLSSSAISHSWLFLVLLLL